MAKSLLKIAKERMKENTVEARRAKTPTPSQSMVITKAMVRRIEGRKRIEKFLGVKLKIKPDYLNED